MRPHLIVCYVDLHSKETEHSGYVADIIDLLSEADIIECAFTFLFKEPNPDSQAYIFRYEVPEFLNDPLGIYEIARQNDGDNEDYLLDSNEDLENGSFTYAEEYMPLYLYFVSSYDIYQQFRKEVDIIPVNEGDVFSGNFYEITPQDQIEILMKLQSFETEYDLVKKIIQTRGEKHDFNLRRLIDKSQN